MDEIFFFKKNCAVIQQLKILYFYCQIFKFMKFVNRKNCNVNTCFIFRMCDKDRSRESRPNSQVQLLSYKRFFRGKMYNFYIHIFLMIFFKIRSLVLNLFLNKRIFFCFSSNNGQIPDDIKVFTQFLYNVFLMIQISCHENARISINHNNICNTSSNNNNHNQSTNFLLTPRAQELRK